MTAAGDPPPPFVRFERKSAADFMVWIATPENYDRDALNAAMTAPDAHGAPRSVVGFFGYSLTPDEDALLTRYEARDTGPDFWAAVEAAGLLGAHGTPHQLGGMPAVVPAEGSHGTLQFAGMPRAIGLPLDLARGPIFSPRTSDGDEVQLALTTTVLGSLHNKPFTVTTKDGLPEVRDGLLLSELIKRYVDQGLPGSRNVDVTTTDLSDAAGYAARGGRQFRLAVDALIRLRSATLENAVRLEDGSLASYVWGMVDAGWMRSGEGGRGQVRLSEELVGMVRRGLLVYYDRETLRGLVDADRYAARLWMFLEAESLGDTPRRYSIFSAPKGAPPAERDTPAIADLLDLREKRRPDDPTGWGRRRDIVRRVRRAAAELQEHDPRYTLTVEQAKSHPSMKNLCVSRRRVPAVAPPVDKCGEVCTPGRAPCVLPVAPLCTPGRAQSDEMPANHESNESAPSVLPSDITVSQILRDTGNGFPVSESEQPIDHDEDAEGQETEKRLEARACPAADIVDHMFGTPDRLADFVSLIGGDERLVDALALTVCRQFQNASGGAVCRGNETGNGIDAAEHLVDGGEVEWCPAFDAAHEVALKIANYLSKREQVKGSPAKYIRACMKRAADDPTEMMGRTRDESKAAYRAMCSLNPAGAKAQADLATKYTPKGIDD